MANISSGSGSGSGGRVRVRVLGSARTHIGIFPDYGLIKSIFFLLKKVLNFQNFSLRGKFYKKKGIECSKNFPAGKFLKEKGFDLEIFFHGKTIV